MSLFYNTYFNGIYTQACISRAGGLDTPTSTFQRFLFATEGNTSSVGSLASNGISPLACSAGNIFKNYTFGPDSSKTSIMSYNYPSLSEATTSASFPDTPGTGITVTFKGVTSESSIYLFGTEDTSSNVPQLVSLNIWKFFMPNETWASSIGSMTENKSSSGTRSESRLYITGGVEYTAVSYTPISTIEHMAFASEGNSSSTGNLVLPGPCDTGMTTTYSYQFNRDHGNFSTANLTNVVDKFSFSSEGNAASVASLSGIQYQSGAGAISSIISAYIPGGINVGDYSTGVATILRYRFSDESSNSNVGTLPTPSFGYSNTSGFATAGGLSFMGF